MDFSSALSTIPNILEKIEEPIGVISLIVILFSFITWAFFSSEGPGFKVFAIILLFVGCAGVAYAVLQPSPGSEGPVSRPTQVEGLKDEDDRPVQTAESKPSRTPIIVGPDGMGNCEYSNEIPEGGIDSSDLRAGTGWLKLRDYHPDKGWFSTTLIRNEDGKTVDPPNPFAVVGRSGQFREISFSETPQSLLGKVIRVSDGLLLRERPFPALNDGENTARYDGTTDVCVQYVSYHWTPRETVEPCLPNLPCEPFVPEETDVWILVSVVE